MANSILDRIKRGGGDTPPRILIAGPEGVGKSTIASKAPNPIFISPEDGLTGLDHVQRFIPNSLEDIHGLLDSFILDVGKFKTIVIDTVDWLERLIAQSICARDGKKDIEDYGYGKGYVILEGELVKLLTKLDLIRNKHKVYIILLSHVQIRTFNDPEGTSYDRFEMKGNKKFTGLLREWPDSILFCRIEVFKTKIKGEQKESAIAGERVMHTQWSPAWDAKNRLGLPEKLPMEWEDLEKAIKENSVPVLIEKVKAAYKLATKIPEADKPRWEKGIKNLESMTSDKLKSAIEKLESLK